MINQAIFGHGTLVYNPVRPKRRERKEYRLIVRTDHGIVEYYHWWLKRYVDKDVQLPSLHAHITIASRPPQYPEQWGYKNNAKVNFIYEPVARFMNGFYWIDVYPNEVIEDVLETLGYARRLRFHITVGKDRSIA